MAIDPNILDVLYGESYDPLVMRVYRGDDLIYERESWDYVLENIDFTNGSAEGYTKPIVPEINGVRINPFNADNIQREFTILMNANTSVATASGNDIGVIGKVPDGPNSRTYSIEIGLGNNGIYYDKYGLLGNDKDKTIACDIQNKDITICKRYDADNNIFRFYCTVDGLEGQLWDWTQLADASGTDLQTVTVGGVGMGSWYYFTGHLNYFKFRWDT